MTLKKLQKKQLKAMRLPLNKKRYMGKHLTFGVYYE